MARIPYPDPDAAPEPVREALAALPPLNIFRMIAHAETAVRPFLAFGGAILSRLELDPLLRELVILRVARLTHADYEWVQHAAIARAVGASDQQVQALEHDDLHSEAFDERTRALLTFTTRAVTTERCDDEAFQKMVDRFTPREIVEVLLTVGQYTMVARIMTQLDLELDEALGPDVLAAAARGRAEQR